MLSLRSKAQFELHFDRWNFRKNLTKEEWRSVTHKIQKRKRDHKESEVYMNGLLMNPKKVQKAMSRYGSASGILFQASSPQTPGDITVRTPLPTPATPAAGGISSAPVFVTPTLPNHTIFSISSLPFVQFKSIVNILEPLHASSPGSNSSTSALRLLDLQKSIVDHFQKGADRDDPPTAFSRNLNALMPENLVSSNTANLQMTLPQPSSPAVDFLNLTLFMASNKLFTQDSDISKNLYGWIKRRSNVGLLESLLSVGGPTAEALAEQVFALAMEAEDAPTIKRILDSGLNPNELRCFGIVGQVTPLERACEMRSLELIRVLLDAGADVNSSSPDAVSPLGGLIIAIGEGWDCYLDDIRYWDSEDIEHPDVDDIEHPDGDDIELVQALLRAGANVNPPDESPLRVVASSCYPKLVDVLLSAGADPNFSAGSSGTTPLVAAVQSSGPISYIISTVRHLLQAGAYVNATTSAKHSASKSVLEAALDFSSIDLIRILLEKGAHITEFAMVQAAEVGNLDIINLFIDSSARVTQEAIECAAHSGEWEIFQRLLDSAEESMKESALSVALIAAIARGETERVETPPISGTKLRSSVELTAAIEAAASRGDISVLRLLLSDGSKHRAAAIESLGCSLNFAIAEGKGDVTNLLLTVGADINSLTTKTKRTPLLEALCQKDACLAQKLLAAGAAVNTTTYHESMKPICTTSALPAAVEFGKTPLTIAVERFDTTTIQLLIDAGADINASAASYSGYTALSAAVRNNDISMVHFLLDLGADPNELSLIAALDKSTEMMQTLLTARLARYKRFSAGFGCPTLQHAIASSNAVMIETLLLSGVDPNTIVRLHFGENQDFVHSSVKFHTESAFGTAIRLDESKDLRVIQMLLRGGADPNKIVDDTTDNTALLSAISKGRPELVKVLIAAGADVNLPQVGQTSATPLQRAVERGKLDIIDILLEQDADVNAPPCGRNGATALQFAAIKGYIGIATMLIARGADVNASPAKVGGRTALEGAAEHGRIDMLQFLLDAGVHLIGESSGQYARARELASENGHIAARRLLEAQYAQQVMAISPRDHWE
ncbi:Ankyrin repeat-containing protein [Cladophialophora immunda]|nr:Ankyrin repeat-containing protein [Cladophialophora immunda]